MTAPALRAVDPALDEIRDRLPDLSQVDLPSLQTLGRRADDVVDRLRGRPRRPGMPWLVAGIGLIGLVAVLTALFVSWYRPRTEPWPDDDLDAESPSDVSDAGSDGGPSSTSTGLTAAEGSLLSYDPGDDRGA